MVPLSALQSAPPLPSAWGNNMHEANVSNIFAADDDLMEESEEEIKSLLLLPVVNFEIMDCTVILLIDSGSQIRCVSENFAERLAKTGYKVLKLPTNCGTVVHALGDRSRK